MFDSQLNQIATAIRNRRIALNYSQEYMAYKLSISQNGYSKTETGQTRMTLDRLLIIASLLDTKIESLLTGEPDSSHLLKVVNE